MRLEELYFSQFYFHGYPTPNLVCFARQLIQIHRDPSPVAWHRLRPDEVRHQMEEERKKNGGPDGQGQHILAQLGDTPYGFIYNRYSYSSIMPEGLIHLCYWSTIGSLPRLLINAAIMSEFPGLSAVVFENYGEAKSIPHWHIHTVVDTRSLLHTVYSREPKIARIS